MVLTIPIIRLIVSIVSIIVSIISIIVSIISIRIHGSAPLRKQEILGACQPCINNPTVANALLC